MLDAYYGGAVDLPTLRTEQERIGHDIRTVEGQLQAANAHLEEWQEVLRLAAQIASTCATAYRRASEKTRRLFNNAVFETVLVRDGEAAEARYCEPFDLLFSSQRFEYGDLAGEEGFEPSNAGSKVRCLTTWRLPSDGPMVAWLGRGDLGRQESARPRHMARDGRETEPGPHLMRDCAL